MQGGAETSTLLVDPRKEANAVPSTPNVSLSNSISFMIFVFNFPHVLQYDFETVSVYLREGVFM